MKYYIIPAGLLTDAGESESMVSYMVSKHGVVALTRSLASCSNNILHKAICPSFADTEIVSSGLEKAKEIEKSKGLQSIKDLGGLMTPEYVAEGFFELLTRGGNGAVMAVFKDVPYILIPDYHKPLILMIVAMSKLLGQTLSPTVVTGKHLILTLTFMILIVYFFLTLLF